MRRFGKRFMRQWGWAAGLLVALALIGGPSWGQEARLVWPETRPVRPPDELLLKWRPGMQASQAPRQATTRTPGLTRVKLRAGDDLRTLLAAWRLDPGIEWVQPNYWRRAQASLVVPNDPYYRPERNQRFYQQWYLPKINANYAWSVSKGWAQGTVAVLDTGVDLNHPDLQGRLQPGVTLVQQEDYQPTPGGQDDNGHGTHVAGIIAAATNNGVGISACTWEGFLLPVKVLNQDGEGTDADIADGIRWAADAGARIINLSLGGPSDEGPPLALQEAVNYAHARGCLVVAASGNSGDRSVFYPASLDNVMAVGATDPWDQRASYSTWGPQVDLAAPGGAGEEAFSLETGILSTYWNENSSASDLIGGSEAGEYAITAGTSMAAAVASGAALVLWGHHPAWTPGQVEQGLKDTAKDLGAAGPDPETGAGLIDVLAALGSPPVDQPSLYTYVYPNPFNPDQDQIIHVVFFLDQPQAITLRIYDAARALVWEQRQPAGQTAAGKNSLSWNGRNGQGRVVANGSYYYRLTNEAGAASPIQVITVLR